MELTKLNLGLPKEKGAFQTTAILRGEEAAAGAAVGAIVTNRIAGQTMSKLRRTFTSRPSEGRQESRWKWQQPLDTTRPPMEGEEKALLVARAMGSSKLRQYHRC